MAMNTTTADALAESICAGLGIDDEDAIAKWKTICREFYNAIVADAVVTVTSVSGVTTGAGVSGPGTGSLS